MNIYSAYILKYNLNHENQIILLMIPNGEGWHYLAVKELSALSRGVTSRNDGGFYCLNCLHSFRTNLNCIRKYVENFFSRCFNAFLRR